MSMGHAVCHMTGPLTSKGILSSFAFIGVYALYDVSQNDFDINDCHIYAISSALMWLYPVMYWNINSIHYTPMSIIGYQGIGFQLNESTSISLAKAGQY